MGLEFSRHCRKECGFGVLIMILLQNVNLSLTTDFSNIEKIVLPLLKIKSSDLKGVKLYKKSVDARHKNNIVFCCSFLVEAENEAKILRNNKKCIKFNKKKYEWEKAKDANVRPVIVGFGPAGMFAALTLCRAGLKPIIIERGRAVEDRIADVENFFSGAKLNPESNIQFGEGGAGTFSDGKLNTGIKDERISVVLETFHQFGASEKILFEAKPHIGTDVLRNVVRNIREEIISLGGEIHFSTRLDDVEISGGKLSKIKITDTESKWIDCSHLVLAIGHSARDTYEMLKGRGVKLERKPFSVGVRIEHLQSRINKALYGEFSENAALGAADYKMAVHLPTGRGVYTFCMCPGGVVVNASSEEKRTCVNGMSFSARDGKNANSALLVEVRPDDLVGDDVLEGIHFQRSIEEKAYSENGVPFCYVGDVLQKEITDTAEVEPTVKHKAVHTDINKVLPDFVVKSLSDALPLFADKINGFDNPNAVLTFPETRSSSPVRILRNEEYNCENVRGIYPIGEGAGYAGGIMSAAVDGMRVAEHIIDNI